MKEMIVAGPSGKKMSSMEIAELVEKRHDNVKRTIESLVGKEVITQPQIEDESYKDGSGRKVITKVYLLDKRSSLIVVAQLSPEFTARVVDRWQELEAQAAEQVKALPTNYKEALLQLVEQVEANEKLALVVEEQKPKVAALERITNCDGYLCVTDAAKTLQIRPKDLFAWMSANTWIYRRAGGSGWLAYQNRIQQGVLSHKVTTVERSDGSQKTVEQVLVTAKGLSVLAEKMAFARA